MMKIDMYNHIFPMSYYDMMVKVAPRAGDISKRVRGVPMLTDLDVRFRVMDMFGDYRQILSLASPPLEILAGPDRTPDLAECANDGMAELTRTYPDRFPSFIATLPLNNVDATLAEIDRAIGDLGACGMQMFTNVGGRPLDEPDFAPIFDAAARHDLPIWIHPARGAKFADYAGEEKSKYEIWWTFGWPYETSAMMARLVFSGLFDRLPEIKIITHHLGGMTPYFEGRVGPGWDQLGSRTSDEDLGALLKVLKKRPIDYFKMFYGDTAVFGSVTATLCGLAFFGADNVIFASDAPFDPEQGPMYIRETIKIVDELDIGDADRAKIYRGNAERICNRAFA